MFSDSFPDDITNRILVLLNQRQRDILLTTNKNLNRLLRLLPGIQLRALPFIPLFFKKIKTTDAQIETGYLDPITEEILSKAY
jgi:hypothetical protein